MDKQDHVEASLREIAVLKRFSATCDALETALRSGNPFNIEAMLLEFPVEYRDKYRVELQGIVEELRDAMDSMAQVGSGGNTYDSKCEYTSIEHLAQGGMGVVDVAWDKNFSRRVALKKIHPNRIMTQSLAIDSSRNRSSPPA